MLHYPTDFPTDAAEQIVKSWRSGTIGADKAIVAECAWNIAGYAFKSALGETQNQLPSAGPDDNDLDLDNFCNDDEMINKLEAKVVSQKDPQLASGILDTVIAGTLGKWAISFLIRVLQGLEATPNNS